MAVETGLIKQAYGVTYTVRTADSGDWASVANSTVFYDIDTDKVYFKNATGGIIKEFSDQVEFTVSFKEVEQVGFQFNRGFTCTAIKLFNVDSLAYDKNETGTYTALTLPADLPLVFAANDFVSWQIAYSAGKDEASVILIGTENE